MSVIHRRVSLFGAVSLRVVQSALVAHTSMPSPARRDRNDSQLGLASLDELDGRKDERKSARPKKGNDEKGEKQERGQAAAQEKKRSPPRRSSGNVDKLKFSKNCIF